MIKCSTCACLVPLLELSEHICKPEQQQQQAVAPHAQRRPLQTRQYSADAQYSGNQQPAAHRLVPHPLRLNGSNQAQGSSLLAPGTRFYLVGMPLEANFTRSIGFSYLHPTSALTSIAFPFSSTYTIQPFSAIWLPSLASPLKFR